MERRPELINDEAGSYPGGTTTPGTGTQAGMDRQLLEHRQVMEQEQLQFQQEFQKQLAGLEEIRTGFVEKLEKRKSEVTSQLKMVTYKDGNYVEDFH